VVRPLLKTGWGGIMTGSLLRYGCRRGAMQRLAAEKVKAMAAP